MIIFKATDKDGYCVFFRNESQAIREGKKEIARRARNAKAERRIYSNDAEVSPIAIYKIDFTVDKDAIIDILNSADPLVEHSQFIRTIMPRTR